MSCFKISSAFAWLTRWRLGDPLPSSCNNALGRHHQELPDDGSGWLVFALWVQFLFFVHLCLPFFQELARGELYQGGRGLLLGGLLLLFGCVASASRRRTAIFSVAVLGFVFLCIICALVGNDLFPPWKKALANASIFGIGLFHIVFLLSLTWIPFLWGRGKNAFCIHFVSVALLGAICSMDLQYFRISGMHGSIADLKMLLDRDTARHIGAGGVLFVSAARHVVQAVAGLLAAPAVAWLVQVRR